MTNYGVIVDPEDVWEMSLGDICARTAAKVPDKTAIIEPNRTCTYKELNDMADALAAGLVSIGVKKGDRVGIILQNSIEAIAAYVGVAKAGAVTVGINPRYREHELRLLLEDSGLSTVITMNRLDDYDYIFLLKGLQKHIPSLRNFVAMEPTEHSDIFIYRDLIEAHRADKYNHPVIDTKKDLITLMYTSGTTGVPKGAMATHYQLIRNSSQFIERLDVTADDVILAQLPWFHAFAKVACLNLSIITGATMVIQDPYNPVETLKMIEKYKCTIHHGTPAMFLMELNNKDFNKYDLSSLRAGVAAGAAFSLNLLLRIKKEMNLNVISAWGMTELSGGGCSTKLSDPDELKTQTVGLPSKDCKVKVCDSNGQELPIGEVGELWFWGWLVTPSYWNNEAETKQQITADGWLKTGDLCRILENGYVQYVGRLKEMINRGGYNVYPRELEDILLKHPKVHLVAVVGIPNEILGELICACVIPKDKNNPPDIIELREYCKDKIADYKLPDELCIMDDFPRTASGKIKKFGDNGIRNKAINQYRQNYRSYNKHHN
jgi:acyl-CoA synthetase (AMP-forming)/AMP-acid ligase II